MALIELPAIEDGVVRAWEQLEARERAPGEYELLESPGLVEGLAIGDRIRLQPGTLRGFDVVERGGNVVVWFYLPEPVVRDSPDVKALKSAVEACGGQLEGGTHGAELIFVFHVSVGFSVMEKCMATESAKRPGSTWCFANVYDPTDGSRPLNWWLKS